MASPTSDFDRHLCGSLRTHEPHEWTGPADGKQLACPGHPPVKAYGRRRLERPRAYYGPWVD